MSGSIIVPATPEFRALFGGRLPGDFAVRPGDGTRQVFAHYDTSSGTASLFIRRYPQLDNARERTAALRQSILKPHPGAAAQDWSRQRIETTGFALRMEGGRQLGVRRSQEYLAVMNAPTADAMKRLLFQLPLGETPMKLEPVQFKAPASVPAATD